MREMDIDLEVSELTEGVEYMAEWDALASFSSFSCASCPAASASTAYSLGQRICLTQKGELLMDMKNIDLKASELMGDVETMPEGNALGCTFCSSTYSSASCPGACLASAGTASTLGD